MSVSMVHGQKYYRAKTQDRRMVMILESEAKKYFPRKLIEFYREVLQRNTMSTGVLDYSIGWVHCFGDFLDIIYKGLSYIVFYLSVLQNNGIKTISTGWWLGGGSWSLAPSTSSFSWFCAEDHFLYQFLAVYIISFFGRYLSFGLTISLLLCLCVRNFSSATWITFFHFFAIWAFYPDYLDACLDLCPVIFCPCSESAGVVIFTCSSIFHTFVFRTKGVLGFPLSRIEILKWVVMVPRRCFGSLHSKDFNKFLHYGVKLTSSAKGTSSTKTASYIWLGSWL